MKPISAICMVSGLLAAVGCGNPGAKPADATTNSTSNVTAAVAEKSTAAPAATVAAAAAPVAVAAPDAGATVAAASAATASAASAIAGGVSAGAAAPSAEDLRKKAQIDWALREDGIRNDPNGHWAVQAKASSTYNDAKGAAPYAAGQATGSPNIEGYGNNSLAWTPKTPDAGIEWLELEYPKAVHATMVRVRESYGSGAVMKVELFDEQGVSHAVWAGTDPTKELDYLVVEFPKTAFKTGRVKLTLATNVVRGANEIDAVQLVGMDQ